MARQNAFGRRLKQIFHYATNKEIADKIGVSPPAVQNYATGRVPPAETLIKIAEVTNCDLHWLLTGEESPSREKIVEAKTFDPIIDRDVLKEMIRTIVREELSIQDLGSVDAFDLEAAIGRGESDDEILSGWYRSEGRQIPDGFLGVLPKLEPPITAEKRRALLKDLKKMLDLKLEGNQ